MTPEQIIKHIHDAAADFAWQAGVGGRETAGAIIANLAAHPERIPAFLAGAEGPLAWPDFVDGGDLTWHANNGKVIHPSEVRTARLASQDPAS